MYSLLQPPCSGVGGLEQKDFQTFRNMAVKLLSNIQRKAEESGCQPQQPQQQHFHEAQVQLQNLCNRHFNSHSSQHQLQENTS